MDLSTLSITLSEPPNFELKLSLSMNAKIFELTKEIEDFYVLHDSLVEKNFATLPEPPPIELFQGDREQLKNTLNVLESYFKELFYRSDICYDENFLEFCGLKGHFTPKLMQSHFISSLPPSQLILGVSNAIVLNDLLILAFEDQINLSKFGCMWSIFEPDILGCIQLYTFDHTLSSSLTKLEELSFEYKIRKMIITDDQKQLIVGRGDGLIDIYHFSPLKKLTKTTTISAHCHALVLLSLHNDRIYTIGYDNSLRISTLTGSIINGGNFTNRLQGDKIIATSMISDKMVLGTSTNNIILYTVEPEKLPKYLTTFNIGDSGPIHTIIAEKNYIFVSHGNYITCFLVSKNSTSKCAVLTDNESPAYSLIVRMNEKVLISSHENKISIWHLKTGKILHSWYTNTPKLHTLILSEEDSLLCAGANNGEFKIWEIPRLSDLANTKFILH